MRWVFLLLLLINIIYLGWEIEREDRLNRVNTTPAINVPKGVPQLVLLSLSELDKLPAERRGGLAEAGIIPIIPITLEPKTQAATARLLQKPSKPDKKPIESASLSEPILGSILCYTYGPIPDINDTELLSGWFAKRGIHYQRRQTNKEEKQSFWVYLPPYESRVLATAALEELEQKGFKDFRLMREGRLLNAISLGVFSSRASANKRVAKIKAAGYQTLVAIDSSKQAGLYWVDVSIAQSSRYVGELLIGFPASFGVLAVDCNGTAINQGGATVPSL